MIIMMLLNPLRSVAGKKCIWAFLYLENLSLVNVYTEMPLLCVLHKIYLHLNAPGIPMRNILIKDGNYYINMVLIIILICIIYERK